MTVIEGLPESNGKLCPDCGGAVDRPGKTAVYCCRCGLRRYKASHSRANDSVWSGTTVGRRITPWNDMPDPVRSQTLASARNERAARRQRSDGSAAPESQTFKNQEGA